MPRNDRFCVTVSPPTLDRTDFASVDQALSAPGAGFSRDWLMARFAEGLEIRMLRAPMSGFVVFQPGRLAWRPIEGAENALIVDDLRVAPGGDARGVGHLWDAVEGFAAYYGYGAILCLTGEGEGLIAPRDTPRRNWASFDIAPDGTRLTGRILHGPMSLPHLPRDWRLRAASVGPGIVLQTTDERTAITRRADALERRLRAQNLPVRRHRLTTMADLRQRAVSPTGLYSVILNGERIGGAETDDAVILDTITQALAV